MRRIDWLAIVLIVFVAIGGRAFTDGETSPRSGNPRRPAPYLPNPGLGQDMSPDRQADEWLTPVPNEAPDRAPLSPRRLREGVIEATGKPRSSTGSASSISTNGVWLTARHVAEGCRETWIGRGRDTLRVTRTVLHPEADIAVLITRGGPRPLPITAMNNPVPVAYNVGFPAGNPGAVDADFLGEMTLWHKGRNGYRERVFAWTERTRFPDRKGSLGGLSGGAVLDSRGNIIGVVQAESPRRGRIMTAMPQRLREIISLAAIDLPTSGASPVPFHPDSFPSSARELLKSLRVAKVFCRA